MKILITGYTPRSSNPDYRRRIGTAQLLRAVLVAAGHDAQVGSWFPEVPDAPFPDDYDLVIVGVSSPMAPSASYTFPAMCTLDALWGQDRLVMFPEDPAAWKFKNGHLSALRDHRRLYNTYLATRMHHGSVTPDDATGAEYRRRILRAASKVSEPSDWPRYLVPAFKGADIGELLGYAPEGARYRAIPVDLTQPYRTNFGHLLVAPSKLAPVDVWLAESSPTDEGLNRVVTKSQRVDVHAYDDAAFGIVLAAALGVLEHSKESGKLPGAWSPTPAIAATVGAFFHGWSGTYDAFGDSYRVLPSAYEDMTPDTRQEALNWQNMTLDAATSPVAEVVETLLSLVGEGHDARAIGTVGVGDRTTRRGRGGRRTKRPDGPPESNGPVPDERAEPGGVRLSRSGRKVQPTRSDA